MTATVLATSLLAGHCADAAQRPLIGTERVAAAEAARRHVAVRAQLLGALDRADVVAGLVARGVDPREARQRVQALTEAEAVELARGLDAAPAGAYWLSPFFVVSVVVALMYVVNRLDVIDRLREAWAARSKESR